MQTCDFLVIGAGVVGLTIARELTYRYPDVRIVVIDKEKLPAQHASGRNSGVLHSGIYYTADSLKARFTRNGNLAWQEYCSERGLYIDNCGKLVLPRNRDELEGLYQLEQRGKQNGVEVHLLDHKQVLEIEPRARIYEQALFVPSTSTVDPLELIRSLEDEFKNSGGTIHYDCKFISCKSGNIVQAVHERFSAGYIINCAGLYAEQVAQAFNFAQDYLMLPFKGVYLCSCNEKLKRPGMHIYPMPDLNNPFLGVHFTRTVDGKLKIGPTAFPALWREHYKGIGGFKLNEFFRIAGIELKLLFNNSNGFRKLAWQELRKQWKSKLIQEAQSLLRGTERMEFDLWGRPGIRAQLLDVKSGKLEMDFVLEGDNRSMHVLNAVSPAFTSAIPFAAHVVNEVERRNN